MNDSDIMNLDSCFAESMKRAAQILFLAVSAVLVCAACARIHLEPKSDSGGAAGGAGASGGAGISATGGGGSASTGSTSGGGGFSFPDIGTLFNPPPPINGKWNVTFVVRGQPQDSSVDFSQNGRTLTGGGQDGDGHQFVIVNGTVDGKKVHFCKKYTDADPSKPMIEYNGELSFQNDQDFKGWSIGGHYKTSVNGEAVDDKWVAVSQATEASQPQAQQPPQAAQPQPDQQAQQAQPDQQPHPEQASAGDQQQQADTNGGGAQSGDIPDNVSGTYTARYEFNFKPVETRLWLKQDKDKGTISGDGTDTNTHEYFVISKGFINAPPDKAPRLMLTFHYQKGVHANKDRDLTVRASVGPGPSLHGETQYGSPWTANFVAH